MSVGWAALLRFTDAASGLPLAYLGGDPADSPIAWQCIVRGADHSLLREAQGRDHHSSQFGADLHSG